MAEHPAAGRVGQVAIRPPEQGLDPAQQLAQAVRLGQVVVRTQLEADDLVDLVVAGGQDEDRHLAARGTDASEDLEAVDAGQADVEHDEIGCLARGDLEPLLAGAGDADVVPLLLERVLDPSRDRVLVLDDQDGRTHAGDATPSRVIWAPARGVGADALSVVSCGPAPGASPQPAPPASRSPHRRDQPTTRGPNSMATARPTLAAEPREVTGKAVKQAPQRRPPAGRRVRPWRRFGQADARRPRVRPAAQARRAERPHRPLGRRQEGQPGPDPGRADPPGQPPTAARRPVPRPHDRGADGRRAARGRRRVARRHAAQRHTAPPDRDASGSRRCQTTCRNRSSTRSNRWWTSTRRSTCATSTIPEDVDAAHRSRRDHRQGPGAADRGRGRAGRRGGRRARRGRRGRRGCEGEAEGEGASGGPRPTRVVSEEG